MKVNYLSRLNIIPTSDTVSSGGRVDTINNETTKSFVDSTGTTVTEGDFCSVSTTTSGTIDLTALTSSRSRSFSLNGLKLRNLKIKAASNNTNPVTIAKGASNGFTGLGASFSITLQPGQEFLFDDNGVGTAVSSTVKNLDVTCTGTQALQVSVTGGG